jgi:hypothetical protein
LESAAAIGSGDVSQLEMAALAPSIRSAPSIHLRKQIPMGFSNGNSDTFVFFSSQPKVRQGQQTTTHQKRGSVPSDAVIAIYIFLTQ